MTKSNSRRFVRAAWSLLFFQVIASAGAVAVTGWAVFHVQTLLAPQNSATTAPAPAEPAPMTTATAPPGAPPPVETTTPPLDSAAPPPLGSAPTGTVVPAQPAIQNCAHVQQFLRVPAEAEWCDTGVEVREGQTVYFRVGEGRWSNAASPAPSYGPEGGPVIQGTWIENAPLGALIGRVNNAAFLIGSNSSVSSPSSGHLLLAMNDVRGTYGDNRGLLDVFIAVR